MLHDALRANGRALDGYRVLVVQRALVAAPPVCEMLAAQGAEIVGPARSLAAALRLASGEPIDVAVLDAPTDDSGPLTALLAAEGVPLLSVDVSAPGPLPGAGLHDLVDRVLEEMRLAF